MSELRPTYADIIQEAEVRAQETELYDIEHVDYLLVRSLIAEIERLRLGYEFVRMCHICGHAVITHRAAMKNEYPVRIEKKSCKECDCTAIRKVCD
jgi:hypothetical protein